MSNTESLKFMLKSLHLPSIREHYNSFARQAESEEWSFEQYLKTLIEQEVQNRAEHRIARLLKRSCLPEGKTLETLDQKLLPVKVRRQIPALCDGGFIDRAENVLVFGLPGRGKTHLVAAVARELIMSNGQSVFFINTRKLVERLLIAKKNLELEKELKKLDKFACIILDDIGYVQQSREEMEVLFVFLSERYERRSLMITSNLVFSEWDKIFKDAMTTAAAIDRLVHHSVILELNNKSYRVDYAKHEKSKKCN
jgi:DNA replication protein DnaC